MPRLLKYMLSPSALDQVPDSILESAEVGLTNFGSPYLTFAAPGYVRSGAVAGVWYLYAHVILPMVKKA